MKRLLSLLFVFCFLLLGLLLYAQTQSGTPKMVLKEETYDAGDVYRTGANIDHAFIIKNTGTADLKILSAKPG